MGKDGFSNLGAKDQEKQIRHLAGGLTARFQAFWVVQIERAPSNLGKCRYHLRHFGAAKDRLLIIASTVGSATACSTKRLDRADEGVRNGLLDEDVARARHLGPAHVVVPRPWFLPSLQSGVWVDPASRASKRNFVEGSRAGWRSATGR